MGSGVENYMLSLCRLSESWYVCMTYNTGRMMKNKYFNINSNVIFAG